MKVQIGQCKDNLFVILPKDAVAQLEWASGDIIDIETADGTLKAVRAMTSYDHSMEIVREIMEEYREAFEALAKS